MSITITGFIYIYLLAKEKHYAWLLGIYDCSVLVYLWYSKGLWGQVFLYSFYVLNGVYAFLKWRKKDENNQYLTKIKSLPITKSLTHISILSVISIIIIIIMVYLRNKHYITSNHTVMDVLIVVFSLYSLILQDHKYLESWIYYLFIDFLVFILYIKVNLYLLAIVKGYFVIMSAYGVVRWIKKYRANLKNTTF